VEIAGAGDLPQLINVLFGNISIQPGLKLMSFSLPDSMAARFPGPRFGRAGLRKLVGAVDRPLLGTALKPMGLSNRELAGLAGRFAAGGMDVIKDDHGLTDQSFSPFEDRVKQCADAVREANERAGGRTGGRTLYFPNITAPADRVMERAHRAKELGAGGVVITPGLTGFDWVRLLSSDDALDLPIMSHPAFTGAFTVNAGSGIAHGALYGQINRLAGADAIIFPNHGGRFSFTPDECRDIVDGTERPVGGKIKPIFPVPAGGMTLDRVSSMLEFYGRDVVLLIGGDVHRHGPEKFRQLI
jgi:ribulose-bisphosphate carboxylase large chain